MITFNCEDKLEIIRNDKVIYSLKKGDCIGRTGIKENSYSMSHGSFKIKDDYKLTTDWIISDIQGGENSATLLLNMGTCVLTVEKENRIRFDFCDMGKFNFMEVKLPSFAGEGIYGGGELFSTFNLKGQELNVWVAEHINALGTAKKLLQRAVGIKDPVKSKKLSKYETYYAQPTFITSSKWFFHSETTARSIFNFTNENCSLVETDSIAPFYIGIEDDYEALIGSLTELTGRQPELPDWVYNGQILGVQGGTDVMMQKYNTAVETGSDVCGIWIQDWEGRRVTAVGKQLFWNWEWDSELYPELDKKIKELNEKGVKVLGYCNPFLAVEKPLYKEASEKGYCVKNKDGEDYYVTITTFPAAMVDFTNPDARRWIKDIIKKNMIDFGLSGWMADFGEYLPTDAVLYSGEDAELVHNTWPARWAEINREAVEECGKLGEIMFFTRAGYSDTPKYSTMMWNGDNHVDFSLDFGLGSVIPAMLTLSCCGFGLSHSDIGGYTTFMNLKRSPELYMRWCEMNAFSLLMRGHEGLNPDLNAQFDCNDEVLALGAKMSKIHTQLKPYLKKLVKENAQNGIPVIRPLFFYYDDEQSKDERFEYLLGRDILVAPVVRPNAKTRKVFLPDDTWVHLESKCEYSGGEYTVDAPIGEPPVFVRKDADKETYNMAMKLF